MKTNKIFITILFIFFTFFTSCEPFSETWDDFFETKCEKENTCSVTVINKGVLPIYVDVTYTDNMPNQKRLIYPNESFTYKNMIFGNLVAWASVKPDCGWRAEEIYVAKCMNYEMSWVAVIADDTKSLKISGE